MVNLKLHKTNIQIYKYKTNIEIEKGLVYLYFIDFSNSAVILSIADPLSSQNCREMDFTFFTSREENVSLVYRKGTPSSVFDFPDRPFNILFWDAMYQISFCFHFKTSI